MNQGETKRVLLVDDEPVAAWALWKCLTQLGYDVLVACSVEDARRLIAKWNELPCAYALLDHYLGGELGFVLIPELRSVTPRPAISVFSGCLDSAVALTAVRHGAIPMGRPSTIEELRELFALLDALNEGASRDRSAPPTNGKRHRCVATTVEFPPFVLRNGHLETPTGTQRLRRAEARILERLASWEGRCVPAETLAEDILGRTDAGARHSVHAHIANLRLNLGRYAAIVESVTGHGYRFNLEIFRVSN